MKLESHVRELMAEKSQIEEEIEEQLLVLRGLGIGMNEPLVDRDGFPRADLDIAGARYARSRVVRLRNDLEAKMVHIRRRTNSYREYIIK